MNPRADLEDYHTLERVNIGLWGAIAHLQDPLKLRMQKVTDAVKLWTCPCASLVQTCWGFQSGHQGGRQPPPTLVLTWKVINTDSEKILGHTFQEASLRTGSPDLYFISGMLYDWTKISDAKL